MNEAAAFIIAQATLLYAEIELMKAANEERAQRGGSQAYGEEQFGAVFSQYNQYLREDIVRRILVTNEF